MDDDDDGDLIILIPPGKSSHALRVKKFSQYNGPGFGRISKMRCSKLKKFTGNKKKKKKTRKVSQISEEEHDGKKWKKIDKMKI